MIGYSGVAIYTRTAVCSPIRAEEGITGILRPPNSSTSFRDLPIQEQIGGYPSLKQLSEYSLDAATLDSEGRCVILEFPAFVLIGVYNPANRDETRDEFRLGFLNALDNRIRNLVAAGKRVVLAGDLNIIREEIDTANAEEQLRKNGMTAEEYVSTPARRLFNQLLIGGKVIGERDEGRDIPVLLDICRYFHPGRKGMFTCWEQKKNARPANFGSRIDYILCSYDCKDWFSDSNIQEGLMGSDHCPVYAILKDNVTIDGHDVNIKDVMNPAGNFQDGQRQLEWSTKNILPLSARLIPEFDRRRSIKDMFTKGSSAPRREEANASKNTDHFKATSAAMPAVSDEYETAHNGRDISTSLATLSQSKSDVEQPQHSIPSLVAQKSSESIVSSGKRSGDSQSASRLAKRTKSVASKLSVTSGSPLKKGQSSLTGFFKPKSSITSNQKPLTAQTNSETAQKHEVRIILSDADIIPEPENGSLKPNSSGPASQHYVPDMQNDIGVTQTGNAQASFNADEQKEIHDPIVAKESWSKILGKRAAPRCEHNEPCVSYLTKKPGVNCGRSFYICPRPIGPSGGKEKGTQWRCGTFIWSSDWTKDST
jgi:AP endonuclease-2